MAFRYTGARRDGDLIYVYREYDRPDGTVGVEQMQMPHTIVSIRAGEYGLDPEKDKDAIWDIILHENEANHSDGMVVPELMTAETLEEARDSHLARCRRVKERHGKIRTKSATREVPDVIAQVHRACLIDPQLIDLHRDQMKHHCRAFKAAQQEPAIDPVRAAKIAMIDRIREREGIDDSTHIPAPELATGPDGETIAST
jgi:hypothetical protein